MSVTVRPVTDAVGAEIIGVDLRNFSDEEFAAIERAWYAHSMILLRGQQLTDDHLLAFSRRFGETRPAAQPGARPHQPAGLSRRLCRVERARHQGRPDRRAGRRPRRSGTPT
jgi:taurine dioxygenase